MTYRRFGMDAPLVRAGVLRIVAHACVAMGVAGGIAVAEDDGFEALPAGVAVAPATGESLLEECLARLPLDPIAMKGWLSMRRPRGVVAKEFDFALELNWGGTPPLARYTVSEKGGAILEQVIARRADALELVRLSGPRLEPVPAPEWNDRIQGSDVTWLDVTLGFLWWKDPTLAGQATVKDRLCDIVEVVPPAPVPGCAKVRLFLDRELKMLLQAEEVDPQGRVTRQMWVRAVKKMGDGKRWMIRDLEVETRGSGHRTRLHVSDLVDSAAP